MSYILSQYWLPSLLSLLLGGFVGYRAFIPGFRGWWPKAFPLWFKLLCLAFVIGLIIAALALLPGRPGLWLDTLLAFVGSYIIGCFLGSWLASLGAKPVVEETRAPVVERTVVATPKPVVPKTVVEPVAVKPAPVPTPAPVAKPVPLVEVPTPVETVISAPRDPLGNYPGLRPVVLKARPSANKDDLKRILGVGPVNEKLLHELGIYTFQQIADWTPQNVEWVGGYLAFGDRIVREDWIGQCKLLAAGLDTEHSRKVDRGEV